MNLFIYTSNLDLKYLIILLSTIVALFVITTKNAIISVFNLIVLYVLVSFYLIYIGLAYIGISYIVVYVGAIAILFLFVIMMIDIEVTEKRNNNYLLLLLLLFGGFLFTLNKNFFDLGIIKIKNYIYIENSKSILDYYYDILFNCMSQNNNQFNSLTKSVSHIKNSLSNHTNNIYDIQFSNLNIESNLLNIDPNLKEIYIFNNENPYINIYNNIDMNSELDQINYLLVLPDWDSAISSVSQISAIGEVLYSTYNIYIYIVSVILLLAMLGAIILTTDNKQDIKFIHLSKYYNNNKLSNILTPVLFSFYYIITFVFNNLVNIFINKSKLKKKINYYKISIYNNLLYMYSKYFNTKIISINKVSLFSITPFYDVVSINTLHYEEILGNLPYFLIANIIIGLLLLFLNSYFSLSIKYLDKGGGFECGFTSFLQTRERHNIAFYRVSLLFLVFDLEIILVFPYPAILQKDENFGKNNIIVFLFILIVGFIYELKEGALNIVKTAHSTEIKIN